jgi:peroxiredoxin
MRVLAHRLLLVVPAALSLLVFVGCGSDEPVDSPARTIADSPTDESSFTAENQNEPGRLPLPTASVGGVGNATNGGTAGPQVEKGSAEWLLREISRMLVQPLPATEAAEQQQIARRTRNLKIVELATEAIAATHKAGNEHLFNAAVHHLMTATKQLALQGDNESVDALYDHAAALYQRDAKSKAAADAAYVLTDFAYQNAQRFAAEEPRWLEEFARQSRMFARNFPQENERAASLLSAAGWSCELHGMIDQAAGCYAAVQEHFPESEDAQEAVGPLRRLNLRNKTFSLAGPTLDGGFCSIDSFRGRPVLVVFWASYAKPFQQQLPQLRRFLDLHRQDGLAVMSVNLDPEDSAAIQFAKQQQLKWPIVFHSNPEQRGWNSPIAVHYGIRNVPIYWLVDREGKVVAMPTNAGALEAGFRSQ